MKVLACAAGWTVSSLVQRSARRRWAWPGGSQADLVGLAAPFANDCNADCCHNRLAVTCEPATKNGRCHMIEFDEAEVRERVSMSEAIARVRLAFTAVEDGLFQVPQRAALPDGRGLSMVAGRVDRPEIVFKILTVNGGNAERGLPTIQSLVFWTDGATGAPTAVMDGSAITALRTGAASGVATDVLAPAASRRLCMLGAGAQAADQIRAVVTVRNIEQVRIWSRQLHHADRLAAHLRREFVDIDVQCSSTVACALRDADIVCAATRAETPLIHLDDLTSPIHINAIGAYLPTMAEVGADVLGRADVLALDDVAASEVEAGDLIQARNFHKIHNVIALGALLNGSSIPTATSNITVYKSVGTAALDWAIADAVYNKVADIEPFHGSLTSAPVTRTDVD